MYWDQCDIDRACDQLAGLDPAGLIVKMTLHGDVARFANREWEATGDRNCRALAQSEFLMEAATRQRCAIDFGGGRGWTLARKPFGLGTLGSGKTHGRMGWSSGAANPYPLNFHSEFDHPYFYRSGRRAAAIAAHLYDYSHERCAEIALRFGLSFETPDFPSWWNPGGTRLVVFIGPAGRDGRRTSNVRRRALAEREAAA